MILSGATGIPDRRRRVSSIRVNPSALDEIAAWIFPDWEHERTVNSIHILIGK
jgi:hypothetical protein